MKKQRKPTAGKCSLLQQLCTLIPAHLVPQLARDTGVADRARTFTPWSHVVSLLYAQRRTPSGSMMSATPCGCTRVRSRPCAAPLRPIRKL